MRVKTLTIQSLVKGARVRVAGATSDRRQGESFGWFYVSFKA